MGEYILRPSAYKSSSNYDVYSETHPVTHAYDDDEETYWQIGGDGVTYSSYSKKCFYGFDLSLIPDNEKILSAKAGLVYSKSSTISGQPACCFAKKLYYSYNSDNALGNIYKFKEPAKVDEMVSAVSNSRQECVDYLNSYKSQIIRGEKEFGLNYESEYRYLRIHEIYLIITTEETTKIFLGETPVTKAYIGTTPLNGIYLGNTKLL